MPKLVWQLATSEPCVRLPGLQQPTPVVIDQPVPSGQPHWSTAPLPEGKAPAAGVQSALP